MPSVGADAAAGKPAASRTLALPCRLPACLDDICHTARSAVLVRTTRTRRRESTRGIAATAFRLRTASGLAYAPTAGIRRRRSQLPRVDHLTGASEHCRCIRLAADLRVRRHASPEVERCDSATRVRAPRSVSDESALTVLAALAGVGIRYYSRRLRKGSSRVRFPAYSAGRRPAEHNGNAHCCRDTTNSQQFRTSIVRSRRSG